MLLAPQDPAIRQRLRAATADLHTLVEARFATVLRHEANGYGDFLLRTARALLALEPAVVDSGAQRLLPDWSQRARLPDLQIDLNDLDLPTPDPLVRPRFAGDAGTFGALYVLEGSRLGAKHLLHRFARLPTGVPRRGTRFLRHASDLPLWATFLQRLEASKAVALKPDETVAGARLAFSVFAAAATDANQEYLHVNE